MASRSIDLVEAGRGRERCARVSADGVTLEVPGDVLADVAASALLVFEELDEQLGMAPEGIGDEAEVRIDRCGRRRAGRPESPREIAEQPRTPEASAPDHDAVAAGLVHHPHGVLGRPDVAVAEHRNARDRLLQGGDRRPVRLTRIELGSGARMQRHGRDAGVLGDAARVEVGEVIGVDALAHLDRQAEYRPLRGPHA